MGKKMVLAVTPSVKLRESQAKLYAFILDKYKSGTTITLPEVVQHYTDYGNRLTYNDQPYHYVYNWKEHRDEKKPLIGDELNLYAIQWFIRNLGIFVVKGLLTAIPAMELSQLQIEEDIK